MNLWATTYEHQRTAWGFAAAARAAASTRARTAARPGRSMTGNGLPRGTMGRIALDICKTNPNVIYAQIEVAPDKETGAAARSARRRRRGGRRADAAVAAAVAAARARRWRWRRRRRRTRRRQPPDPQSNGIWRSIDKGKTWTFMSNENQRPMYFSQIRVDPNRPEHRLRRRRQPAEVHRRRQDVHADSQAWATSTTTRSGSIR